MLMGLSVVYGQDEECATILPDSAYAVSLPWYNNNQFLTDYLTNRGFYNGGLALRVPDPCPQARYQIPLRINIYRNTQGIGSITQGRAAQLVDSVNLIFQNAGTSIQFYIDNISVFTNNFYSTGIQTVGNSLDLFHHNWSSGWLTLILLVVVEVLSQDEEELACLGIRSFLLPIFPFLSELIEITMGIKCLSVKLLPFLHMSWVILLGCYIPIIRAGWSAWQPIMIMQLSTMDAIRNFRARLQRTGQ